MKIFLGSNMFWLIALVLPLVLFSCSKNPVDTQDQPKATGKFTVVCTYSPTVTAKILASTVSAEITFWVKSNPANPSNPIRTVPLVYDGAKGEFFGSAFDVPAEEYCVTVKGFDSAAANKRMTYYGSASNVKVTAGATATVTIQLFRPGAVTTFKKINMVSIPSGCFAMGDIQGVGSYNERHVHTVTLSAFEISATEITQGQFKAVMSGANPSGFHGDDNLPVDSVTWDEAVEFCAALGSNFHLPTEAEWEYACRAGTTTNFYTGNAISTNLITSTDLDKAGWYDSISSSMTHAVGGKTANAFGLYDMHGNVLEWCNDWWNGSAGYTTESVINPTGASMGSFRVIRGGGWRYAAYHCRSAMRSAAVHDYRYSIMGFRVVRRP